MLLDPGDVGRVGARVERVGLLLRVEPDQGAGLDQLIGEAAPLLVGPVHPDDTVGGGQFRDLTDPGEQFRMGRRGLIDTPHNSRSNHDTSPCGRR